MKVFGSIIKCIHFFFNWNLIIFVWLSLCLSFFKNTFNFIHYLMPSSILSYIYYMKILISLQKCPFSITFYLYLFAYQCIWCSFKNIQFYKLCYIILIFIIHILDENPQFYMKMSPCLLYVLITFLCLSLYLSFSQINLHFYQLP